MFQKMLIGLDGSDASRNALERAVALAKLLGASLHALSVEERLPAYAATVGEVQDEQRFENQYFRGVHEDARRISAGHGVNLTDQIVAGHAADELVRVATERGVDLIVLGHTGHSRLHHLFLGSTADRVVEHAACAVLVVR